MYPPEELDVLENVLPFQLLASGRYRAEDYIAELLKKTTPQQVRCRNCQGKAFLAEPFKKLS